MRDGRLGKKCPIKNDQLPVSGQCCRPLFRFAISDIISITMLAALKYAKLLYDILASVQRHNLRKRNFAFSELCHHRHNRLSRSVACRDCQGKA